MEKLQFGQVPQPPPLKSLELVLLGVFYLYHDLLVLLIDLIMIVLPLALSPTHSRFFFCCCRCVSLQALLSDPYLLRDTKVQENGKVCEPFTYTLIYHPPFVPNLK